jgi:hypothetical protein
LKKSKTAQFSIKDIVEKACPRFLCFPNSATMKKDHSKLQLKNISIKQPCSENWQDMDSQTGGRFCRNCQKQVIDFTDKTDEDLRRIIEEQGSNLCGRFRKSQIAEPLAIPEKRVNISGFFKKAAATAATLAIMQTAAQAVEPPTQAKIEINDTDKLSHPDPSPNTMVTGVVLTTFDENIPDDILVKLVYQSTSGRKTVEQTTHAGLFNFDLADKSIPGSPIIVVVPEQTIKAGHAEHKYHTTRFTTMLVEGQNLAVNVKVDGLWDDILMGDIGFMEE